MIKAIDNVGNEYKVTSVANREESAWGSPWLIGWNCGHWVYYCLAYGDSLESALDAYADSKAGRATRLTWGEAGELDKDAWGQDGKDGEAEPFYGYNAGFYGCLGNASDPHDTDSICSYVEVSRVDWFAKVDG